MFSWDLATLYFINGFAQQSWAFDRVVGLVAVNHLLKGGVFSMLLWWAWYPANGRREDDDAARRRVLAALVSCVAAMASARALALLLPFHARPIHSAGVAFVLPHGATTGILDGWSSFPSDHAALFFCLATSLWFISRGIGWFALAYAALFIAFPRVYLGLHYPSDVLAGAALGSAIALLGQRVLPDHRLVGRVLEHADRAPRYAYPLLFLVTYQIADMFESSRMLAHAVGVALTR